MSSLEDPGAQEPFKDATSPSGQFISPVPGEALFHLKRQHLIGELQGRLIHSKSPEDIVNDGDFAERIVDQLISLHLHPEALSAYFSLIENGGPKSRGYLKGLTRGFAAADKHELDPLDWRVLGESLSEWLATARPGKRPIEQVINYHAEVLGQDSSPEIRAALEAILDAWRKSRSPEIAELAAAIRLHRQMVEMNPSAEALSDFVELLRHGSRNEQKLSSYFKEMAILLPLERFLGSEIIAVAAEYVIEKSLRTTESEPGEFQPEAIIARYLKSMPADILKATLDASSTDDRTIPRFEGASQEAKNLFRACQKMRELGRAIPDGMLDEEQFTGYLRHYSNLVLWVLRHADTKTSRQDGLDTLQSFTGKLLELEASSDYLAHTEAILEREADTADVRDFDYIMAMQATQAALLALVHPLSETQIELAREIINHDFKNDPLPYAIELSKDVINPEAAEAHVQVMRVLRRSVDLFHGFSSLTFESRKPPNAEFPLLAQFGLDCARRTGIINCSDKDQWPGNGFLLGGIDPAVVFFADPANERDPFHLYKKAWPWAAHEIDDLRGSTFIFMRAYIAVVPPPGKKYSIDGVHYSYVAFNDHFHNPWGHIAFLVPSVTLQREYANVVIPAAEYKGFSQNHDDVLRMELSPEALLRAEDRRTLNIGWASNFGGLCNAFQPTTRPFHRWEVALLREREQHTADLAGHVHKSHILGEYSRDMTRELHEALAPLQEAHELVYEKVTAFQNLFDLFRLGHAQWHKGQTINRERPETELRIEAESDNLILNPDATRMLKESYRWHRSGRRNLEDYPILVLAEALNYSRIPRSPFLLDTRSMVLSVKGKEIQFPQNGSGSGEREEYLWQKFVLPYLADSRQDLRFLDRRIADLIPHEHDYEDEHYE